MSPHLTTRGRWLLLSGALFLVLGAAFSSPLILFIGQVQILVLAIAFMLLVPGALALDRRQLHLAIQTEDTTLTSKSVALVGQPLQLHVALRNESEVTLHALRLSPFAPDALAAEPATPRRLLPARALMHTALSLTPQHSGRWVIQGFDVRICDPIGLIETRDYLPASHPVEVFPLAIARKPPRLSRDIARREAGRHPVEQLGLGTDVRELREHQPGDPLRHIAWKATVRRGKLISKNFEHESSMSVYILLDISCSMRGGQRPGQKLEHAVGMTLNLAEQLLKRRDAVGLMTFDEKLYGHVLPGSSPHHLQRISHHLVGLNAVVDPELTELNEDELEALVADYLLIQERLDFRKGDDLQEESGVNRKLLQRWMMSNAQLETQRFASPTLSEGIAEQRASRLRRFAQLRGVPVPYRSEARLGMKERGLVDALERLLASSRGRHAIIVISDLCGIMNLDLLSRGVKLSAIKGNRLKFIVPFTPSFYDNTLDTTPKRRVIKELFTSAERDERMRIVARLRSLGAEVELSAPSGTP